MIQIDVPTGKDALGSLHWDVDPRPITMQLEKPAAFDGPQQTGTTGIVERPLGGTTVRRRSLCRGSSRRASGSPQPSRGVFVAISNAIGGAILGPLQVKAGAQFGS